MDIQFEKLELIKMLAETNDSDIVSAVKNIFVKKRNDFWEELTLEQKQEIELSDSEIENGNFFLYEDVMAKHR
jgi:hypothetical protein